MKWTLSVRALKEHASDILRRVREDGASFEVNYHGRVIARLVPDSAPRTDQLVESYWAEWDELSEDIGAHWPRDVSAMDAVRAERRESDG